MGVNHVRFGRYAVTEPLLHLRADIGQAWAFMHRDTWLALPRVHPPRQNVNIDAAPRESGGALPYMRGDTTVPSPKRCEEQHRARIAGT